MNALMSFLSIISIIVLVRLYNGYRTDVLRQALFELRDALFDEAMAGKISFQSPAYQATRTLLNGMIRFGHKLNGPNFIGFLITVPKDRAKGQTLEFFSVLNSAPESERNLCLIYVTRAHLKVAGHLLGSPFLLPLAMVLLLVSGVESAAKRVVRLGKPQFAVLDNLAFREGLAVPQTSSGGLINA